MPRWREMGFWWPENGLVNRDGRVRGACPRSLWPGRERRRVKLRLEANQNLAAAELEHRPLDHRRLSPHQRHRLVGIEAILVPVGQLAERRAGPIEQRLPADFLFPALEPLALDAGSLVVMKRVGDATLLQPGARLLH